MRRNVKYKPKYFPFSSGIPWQIDRGKYIIPKIDMLSWKMATDNKGFITIICFGGLFESFYSLIAAESISSINKELKIHIKCDDRFLYFSKAQGICKYSNLIIDKDVVKKYPVPLFFDADNNVYLNILNNYNTRSSYWGKYEEEVKGPATKQLYENSLISTSKFPVLRDIEFDFYNELISSGLIKQTSKIITIITNDNRSSLDWSLQNIKEFSQLVATIGFKVVVFTDNVGKFYGTKTVAVGYDIRKITQLIKKSWMVLSSDVDWLLISMISSKANIISNHVTGYKNLLDNAEFLETDVNVITDMDGITPINAYAICKGLI